MTFSLKHWDENHISTSKKLSFGKSKTKSSNRTSASLLKLVKNLNILAEKNAKAC